MSTKIREMTSEDWPRVAEIYKEGMDSNLSTFQTECPLYEDWDCAHLKVGRLVIEADGTVVGWTALSAVSSRCVYAGVAELIIYLDFDHHGKGLGSQLLSALISESEKAGFWTLQSGIMQNNTASIRLHEKCGFRTVGYRERIGCDRFGVWRNTVLMERRSAEDKIQKESCSCCQK